MCTTMHSESDELVVVGTDCDSFCSKEIEVNTGYPSNYRATNITVCFTASFSDGIERLRVQLRRKGASYLSEELMDRPAGNTATQMINTCFSDGHPSFPTDAAEAPFTSTYGAEVQMAPYIDDDSCGFTGCVRSAARRSGTRP